MPRTKQTKTSRKSRVVKKVTRSTRAPKSTQKATSPHWTDKWTQSYSSFLLGIVVVIVAVLFGVSIIRQQNHTKQVTSLSTGPTPTVAPTATPTPGTTMSENGQTYYIVKPNDSLWNIAVAVYNNGYKWVDIAKANNITNPGTIFTGDKLLLPNAPTPSELGQLIAKPNPTAVPDAITANTYTIQKGDTLWSIAVRAYADGYQWTKIAQANNLANPGTIFSGNVLTLPR